MNLPVGLSSADDDLAGLDAAVVVVVVDRVVVVGRSDALLGRGIVRLLVHRVSVDVKWKQILP